MAEWCARERRYFPASQFETAADGSRVHRTAPRHWATTGALIDESEPGPAPTDVMEEPDAEDATGTNSLA